MSELERIIINKIKELYPNIIIVYHSQLPGAMYYYMDNPWRCKKDDAGILFFAKGLPYGFTNINFPTFPNLSTNE